MHIYKQENLFYRSENRHVRVFEDDEFQCCISDLCREMRGKIKHSPLTKITENGEEEMGRLM